MQNNNKTNGKTPLVLGNRQPVAKSTLAPWKVVIVDDEDEILRISKLVLKDFVFDGRDVEIITGSSGHDAMRLLAANPDTAVLMIDVVMETEHAGLDAVRHIRDVLGNTKVRIILRTGQPGQAPERQVIIDYDINDYKEKTEMTAQKLVTTLVTALRGYRDIKTIDTSRKGLEQIVRSAATLFAPRSLAMFSQGVLQQVTTLFNLDEDSVYMQSSGFTAVRDSGTFQIIAGTGRYAECAGKLASSVDQPDLHQKLELALSEQRTIIDDDGFLGYYRTSGGAENVVYVRRRSLNSTRDDRLLEVLSTNLAVAFDNIHLNREVRITQEELIRTLSEVVETRSQEVSHHVDRVAAIAALLGKKLGLSDEDTELLRVASPMHDLGKIGIPDAILCKPGKFDAHELDVIRTHPDIGYAILKASSRPSLQAAATICHQHHEYWDGNGYPQRLKGEEIHIFGRIVALADVLDALTQERAYKKAWPMDRVIDYIREQRGTHFDPALVDLFMAHLDEFAKLLAPSAKPPDLAPVTL